MVCTPLRRVVFSPFVQFRRSEERGRVMGSLRAFVFAAALACAWPLAWAGDPASSAAASSSSSSPAQKSSPSSQAQKSSHSSASARPQALDLKAPDVRQVMSPSEVQAAVSAPDPDEEEPPPQVQVSGDKPAPAVPGGIASLWWGFTHPSQIWRIFAPAQ
jgi:hypothetical protein